MDGSGGSAKCVAKLEGDSNIVTEMIHNTNQTKGRSWSHVKVLYVISLFSLALHLATVFYLLTGGAGAGSFPQTLSLFPDHHNMKKAEELYADRERRETSRNLAGNVEFVHPDLKAELSSQDEDPDNPWVWLTSYSRIPLEAIQDFCSATKTYCPPGKEGKKGSAGLAGIPGIKGEVGPVGPPGMKGNRGHRGTTGKHGPQGPKGLAGLPGMPDTSMLGLDGRDGLPGEPGLDGVHGRSGLDGLPGLDGVPGTPGTPGLPGTNGRDGDQGVQGHRGPIGPQGERGLPGPRGREGEDGRHGEAGTPGVCAWLAKGGCSKEERLLLPPRISDSGMGGVRRVIVREKENLMLTCATSGDPKPTVTWSRKDGWAVIDGPYKRASYVPSPILNITHINRAHMGTYVCEAFNGIPPNDTQEFRIDVYFSPTILVAETVIGAYQGQTMTLECRVESWPRAVNYWEKEGRVLAADAKYNIVEVEEAIQYKFITRLTVTLEDRRDEGTYYCVSKNELGITRGNIQVFKRDPNRPPPPKSTGKLEFEYFGDRPPQLLGFEDICPKRPPCPDCANMGPLRCEGSARIFGVAISPFDPSLPGITNRTEDCTLETIGKPVFKRYTADQHGGWLMDPEPRDPEDFHKIWTTSGSTNTTERKILQEFADEDKYRKGHTTKKHSLELPFTGSSNAIFNGSFFYYNEEKESIVKYDLATKDHRCLQIPTGRQKLKLQPNQECRQVRPRSSDFLTRLYPEMGGNVIVDLAVDENGLWAIMAMKENNNTLVMKISAYNMELIYAWNISLNHNLVADMFVVCGVLYAVDSTNARNTKIRLALDLYTHQMLEIELPFTNPFRHTTMLGYNPRRDPRDSTRRPGGFLFTWDGGNQLTYPVKYHDIGYKEPPVTVTDPPETGAYTDRSRSGVQIETKPDT